jgi:hypothetical protein
MLVEFNVEFKINLHLWFPGVAERPWNENYSEDELHRRRRNRRSSQKFWLACKTDDVSHNPSLRTISHKAIAVLISGLDNELLIAVVLIA